MQGKEVYLKKINKIILYSVSLIIFIYSNYIIAKEYDKNFKIDFIKKINNINELSSDFIQYGEGSIEEGNLYIKDKRVKIQYNTPSQITIIISNNKAMYFNQELEEVEYFNPKNNLAGYFYEIFYNNNFFDNASFLQKNNSLIITKNILLEKENFQIKLFFEINPFVIRKLKIKNVNGATTHFSISNINYNPDYGKNKNFFSMAHPLIKNN